MTITLPLTPTEPAFIVNTGIPETPSQLYLIREVAGQLAVTYLCDASTDAALYWLDDVVTDSPATITEVTFYRQALAGGRWLLLDAGCLLDAETLTAYRFPLAPANDSDAAPLAKGHPPLGFAPDQRSFVRVGFLDEYDVTNYESLRTVQLFVYDFVASTVYTLPVDTDRMYYTSVSAGVSEEDNLNATWLDRHFAWQPQADAPDRLVERPDFAPLFPLGLRLGYGSDLQYRLQPVQAGMIDQLATLLEQEFDGQLIEREHSDEYGAVRTSFTFRVGDQQLVADYSKDEYSIPAMTIWQPSSSPGDGTLLTAVGDRFDAVLQSGVHNALYDPAFLGNPANE